MIADKEARKKGYASEVLPIMIDLGSAFYQKSKSVAKIKTSNLPSIKLFEKLGFTKLRELQKFEEVHY